jgi:glutaminyl-tRNA synthetase
VRATYDPATRGGDAPLGPDGKPVRKVKGTIHWVSAELAIDAEVRLYDRLFTVPEPGASEDFLSLVNPNSLEVVQAKLEPSLAGSAALASYQFERLGYFTPDAKDNTPARLVFNRTITLRDAWAK